MKFLFKSDFHLDFHVAKDEKAIREYARDMYFSSIDNKEEKLPVILGGDFANENVYGQWFISELQKYADAIFVVFGNHDLYDINSEFRTAELKLKNFKEYFGGPETSETPVHFLENFKVVEYKGLKIGGSTNWYKQDTVLERIQFKLMNDSRFIREFDIGYNGHLEDLAFEKMENVDIMVTHVSPIYTNSNHRKGAECYMSPRDVTKAKHWFCGHVHEHEVYEKAGCFIYTDANGYDGEIDTRAREGMFMTVNV